MYISSLSHSMNVNHMFNQKSIFGFEFKENRRGEIFLTNSVNSNLLQNT